MERMFADVKLSRDVWASFGGEGDDEELPQRTRRNTEVGGGGGRIEPRRDIPRNMPGGMLWRAASARLYAQSVVAEDAAGAGVAYGQMGCVEVAPLTRRQCHHRRPTVS